MSPASEHAVPPQTLLQATPVEIAGNVLQPVVRLQKWQVLGDAGHVAFVRLSPHAVHVQAGDKRYVVPIHDPTQATLQMFFYWGAAISGVCLLIMLLTTWFVRRRSL